VPQIAPWKLLMRQYLYNIITGREKGPLSFVIRIFLIFCSFFYLIVVKLRFWLYRIGIFSSFRLKTPVISIGNITWGGTGKTPLVEVICRHFLSDGKRIALLIRGYGMDEDKFLTESMQGVSVLVGGDRAKNAKRAEEEPLDLFVLDDGFQHLKIARDINILTIDAGNPFGNGYLIPAGILREAINSVARAHIAVITKTATVSRPALDSIKGVLLKHNPGIEIYESNHQPLLLYTKSGEEKALEHVKGRRVCAVSALGDNDSFKTTIRSIGSDIGMDFSYMDHHRYSTGDIERILNGCKEESIDTVVTTEKDWVKIKDILGNRRKEDIEFLILKIRLKVDDEKSFFRRLSLILSG